MRHVGNQVLEQNRVHILLPRKFSERLVGWLVLIVALPLEFLIALCWLQCVFQHERSDTFPAPIELFVGLIFCYLGWCLALEHHSWVIDSHYFETRTRIGSREKIMAYTLDAWAVQHRSFANFDTFTIRPVGRALSFQCLRLDFEARFETRSAIEIMEIGRELEEISGWPLRIPCEMLRLEADEIEDGRGSKSRVLTRF